MLALMRSLLPGAGVCHTAPMPLRLQHCRQLATAPLSRLLGLLLVLGLVLMGLPRWHRHHHELGEGQHSALHAAVAGESQTDEIEDHEHDSAAGDIDHLHAVLNLTWVLPSQDWLTGTFNPRNLPEFPGQRSRAPSRLMAPPHRPPIG